MKFAFEDFGLENFSFILKMQTSGSPTYLQRGLPQQDSVKISFT